MTQSGVVNVIEKDDGYETVNFTPELAKNAFRDFLDIAEIFQTKPFEMGKLQTNYVEVKISDNRVLRQLWAINAAFWCVRCIRTTFPRGNTVIQPVFTTDDFDLNINAKRFEVNKAFSLCITRHAYNLFSLDDCLPNRKQLGRLSVASGQWRP